jgi:aminoglycoside phosphotransferase (APT) family kinase protein
MSAFPGPASGLEPELIEPRADEHLPLERLESYLRESLPQTSGELEILQFAGGRANHTYLLRFDDAEYVLRRPPLGPVAPSSHDMKREYRVLSRLYRHLRLAPRSYLYCEDESLIGAPFQVMERRRGIVIRERVPPPFDGDPAVKRRIGEMLVDVLAELHLVDREAAGLDDLGRPEGFVERQLEGWVGRWEAAAHEENRAMRKLVAWLRAHRPASRYVSLLHNDYKLDNLLVDACDPAVPVAILDWDMCTSGDPLMDVGYLLNQWAEARDDPAWIAAAAIPSTEPGFPSRGDVVERYARRSGFDLDDIHWYYAFAAMKFAAVIQQIFIRYHRGQTRDERFAGFDERARIYVRKGCEVIAGRG